jgi:hypothetical protein
MSEPFWNNRRLSKAVGGSLWALSLGVGLVLHPLIALPFFVAPIPWWIYLYWPEIGTAAARFSFRPNEIAGTLSAPSDSEIPKGDLDRLFKTQGPIVFLKFLPDTQNRNADAFLVILLGYMCVNNLSEVPTDLARGALTFSGCHFKNELREWQIPGAQLEPDDVAKAYLSCGYIKKAGLSKGGTFALTPSGIDAATTLFSDMLRRG